MVVTNFNLKYFLSKLIMPFVQFIDTGLLHPVREREVRALNSSVNYIDQHMPNALGFESQKELIKYALKSIDVAGAFLEFGVFTGGTIRFIAKCIKGHIIHGFDSFEGLPSAWHGMPFDKNAFNMRGKLPRVPENVVLHKGWFDETIPKWCAENQDKLAFIHVDCDLYQSTQIILNALFDRFQVGTIILFDEYFNYPNWQNHEFKAWQEFVSKYGVQYEYIGFARRQVAVKILDLKNIRS